MPDTPENTHFIRQIIDADLAAGRHTGVITRFPPEPNGYLHIGHAKSIWLNFGLAADYRGRCILRYDDTNPEKEEAQFIQAIEQDIRWLGYDLPQIAYASDYFPALYDYAVRLIEQGLAYVDSQSAEQIRQHRGTLTEPGQHSPDRRRSIDDNTALFARMRAGEFTDGALVLRAKIDMAAANLNLRDPVIYRIRHHPHPRTGDRWCIYPLYDFAHGLSDAIEGVTHSLCTLEFADHRPLYDWFIEQLAASTPRQYDPHQYAPHQYAPHQYEFARMNLSYTVMSKRLLSQLLVAGDVDGWDDPRMPTLCGLRRRGFTPAALRHFISLVGITKKVNLIEMEALENCIRADLEPVERRMAVLQPLKLTITNYPAPQQESITAPNHPADAARGSRQISLGRELYIERDDFMEEPPKRFHRLAVGREVRLRYAFVVKCTEVIKDAAGTVVELRCEYDPHTRGGQPPAGRKVKGIIHWVNANTAVDSEVRLYDRLFSAANPLADKAGDFRAFLNPDSLQLRAHAKVEPALAQAPIGSRYQFERSGYFCVDRDSRPARPVFNRIVTLRDSWAKTAPQ